MAKPKIDKGKRQDCLNAAQAALSLLEPNELNDYLTKVFSRVNNESISIEQAMDRANHELLSSMVDEMAIKARDIVKHDRNINKYMKAGLNLRNFMISTSKNRNYNLETSQKVERQELFNDVMGTLTGDEIKQWQSGKLDDAIMAAADGKKTTDPLIKKLGELYRKYPQEIRNPRMIESDALSINQVREDRFLRNSHDASKVANAGMSLSKRALTKDKISLDQNRDIWVRDIKAEMDIQATAKNINALNLDGSVDEIKVDAFIKRAFDNIINNRSAVFTKSTIANDQDAMNRKKHQYIVFKDWSSFNRYNKKYGRGNMFQAMIADIRSSGNKIGIARIFGSSPYSMLNDLKRAQLDIRPISNFKMSEAEALFKQVSGTTSGFTSPTLAAFGSSLRGISAMSRLGNIVLQSLNDYSAVSGIMQRFGYSFWKPYADNLVSAFGLIPDADRQLMAKQMRGNIMTHMGYMGNWAEVSNMGEVMSKLSNTFYWLNFLEGWTGGIKLSAMTSIGKALGTDSAKAIEALHPQTQFQLNKFGINSAEWNALRAKTTKAFFSLDNVNNLSRSELNDLWEKSDKNVSRGEYRAHLNRKVYGLFDMVSENASLDPGAYERMVTTANISAGTIPGEVVRAVMQFKSYPISYFRKAFMGGMSDMQGAQGKLMYATTMAASNFMLGYVSLVLANIALNKTTPAIADMPFTDIAMMLAPGLVVFAKILSSKNQTSEMAVNMLLTASVRLFTDPLAATAAIATGNVKGAKKMAKDFLNYANPIGSLPIVDPLLKHLMGEKPYLQPGQHEIFGA